jgi:hypothetical protein
MNIVNNKALSGRIGLATQQPGFVLFSIFGTLTLAIQCIAM